MPAPGTVKLMTLGGLRGGISWLSRLHCRQDADRGPGGFVDQLSDQLVAREGRYQGDDVMLEAINVVAGAKP